jgi:hypothetical protein
MDPGRIVQPSEMRIVTLPHEATTSWSNVSEPADAELMRHLARGDMHALAIKVAMIACMRKLVTILNVMVQNNQHWREPILQNA